MDCLLQLQILGLHCKALSESLRKVSNVIGSQTTLWGIKFLILCAPNMELDTECRTYCFGCPTGGNIGQKFNFTSGTTYLNDFFCILSLPVIWSFPGEGNGNPLQYSCLKNFMDSGAWQYLGSQKVGCDWSNLARTHRYYTGWSLRFCTAKRTKVNRVAVCRGHLIGIIEKYKW